MSKKFLTMNEKRLVMNYLEVHCVKPPENSYAIYDQVAKNDQHVADLFKPSMPNINHIHVQGMRQEMDLLLEPARKLTSAYVSQIASLEQVVATLTKTVNDLQMRVTALEDKYTDPKEEPPEIDLNKTDYLSSIALNSNKIERDRWINKAAGKAVAAVLDPHTEKAHPVKAYHKSKHSH